jgi:hypothetical protein
VVGVQLCNDEERRGLFRLIGTSIDKRDKDEDKGGQLHRQQLLSDLDLSTARILQLRGEQLPPQGGVLWLELHGAAVEWGQLSPGLVVLVAPSGQVSKAHVLGDSNFDELLLGIECAAHTTHLQVCVRIRLPLLGAPCVPDHATISSSLYAFSR